MTLPVFGVSRLRMGSDGSGVTTLVGTLGCPLKCRYCLNPRAGRQDTPVRLYDAEELLDRVRIDGLYFAATGGGVTFGGGEPLLHADFLAEFGGAMPEDWKLRVETCLNVPRASVEGMLPVTDEWIVDVKDMNPEIYRAYTGQDNVRVLENLTLLAEVCPERVHLRVPSVPGYNDVRDCDHSEALLRRMGFDRIERFDYIIKNSEG